MNNGWNQKNTNNIKATLAIEGLKASDKTIKINKKFLEAK